MKKSILCIALAFASYVNAQVGIGIYNPRATLDITVNGSFTTPEGLLIPRISRETAKNVTSDPDLVTTPEESTLIYVNLIEPGTEPGENAGKFIDAKGFYYYSRVNSRWMKIYNNSDGSSNPFELKNYEFENGLTPVPNGNNSTKVTLGGELVNETIITNAGNRLVISGDIEDAFSVDGATFSVDGTKNSVGIGTTTPQAKLHIYNKVDAPDIAPATIQIVDGTEGLGKVLTSNANGVGTWQTLPLADVSFTADNGLTEIGNNIQLGGDLTKQGKTKIRATTDSQLEIEGDVKDSFSVDGSSNRVGIGTIDPQAKLHVKGNMQLEDSLNVGSGSGNPGSLGQVLMSAGPNNSPTWQDIPSGGGTTNLAAVGTNGVSVSTTNGTATVKLGGLLVEETKITAVESTSSAPNNTLTIDGDVKNAFSVTSSSGPNLSVDNKLGNVGIGTDSPDTKLHVAGQVKIAGGNPGLNKVLTSSDNSGLATWQAPTIITATSGLTTTGNEIRLGGRLSNSAVITTTNDYKVKIAGATENAFYVQGNGGVNFSVNNSTNKVGIGTTVPQAKLDIRGDIRIVDGSEGLNKVLTSDDNGFATWKDIEDLTTTGISIDAANGLTPSTTNGITTVKLGGTLTDTNGTTITSTSASKLKIAGNVNNAFSVVNTNAQGAVTSTNLSVDNANNRVGIGTASPSTALDVAGELRIRTLNESSNPGSLLTVDNNGVVQKTNNDFGTYFLGGTVYVNYDTTTGGNTSIPTISSSYSVGGINRNGSIGGIRVIKGNGYKISNPEQGIFDIEFDIPFRDIYGISVNIVDSYRGNQGGNQSNKNPYADEAGTALKTNDNSQVSFISNTIISIKTGNSAGTNSNRSFTFLVTGK